MDAREQRWEFAVAPPRSAPGVGSMVGYRALDVPDAVHRGLPSSRLTFIVSLDDGVEGAATAAALAATGPIPVILGGLHVRTSHVRLRRGQAGVQLAVHPLAARALFGVPAAELSVTDFDAAAVLGRPAVDLRDRLAEAPGWRERFALVTGHLVAARGRRRDPSVRPEVAYAWHELERSRGCLPVGALADRVGLTARHLGTLFRREVGRGPKTVARLIRFEHAVAAIADSVRRSGGVDLAGVAAATGHYDQAHLTREFVSFAGVPPRAWLAEEFRSIQDGGHAGWSDWADDEREPDRVVDAPGA
ncbi:helix-turn-helix domain-containing protein [Phytohabitans sp. ZYX-F-186]|uniref:Helix-turn-helix domain-containing protein n=1 Tax=Phytohabitans maris TaxID=3071409 RepID=A0ABU0ZSC9_9ACTN|nr:helix-turn-helix domain-containing protein [Phytohabitans sp. ZYX-F-186]MDQ7909392.1 helix-turn-helix domain-containing protein [Phytohabitans sp. ZYX-F-186]